MPRKQIDQFISHTLQNAFGIRFHKCLHAIRCTYDSNTKTSSIKNCSTQKVSYNLKTNTCHPRLCRREGAGEWGATKRSREVVLGERKWKGGRGALVAAEGKKN
jgi:hypothetical protein